MSAAAFAEVSRCANAFAVTHATGQRLHLELAALTRDQEEWRQKLNDALANGNDVHPIMMELRDLVLEMARVLAGVSANAKECAALCRQSAAAVKKLTR